MARRALSFAEEMERLRLSGIGDSPSPTRERDAAVDGMPTLRERLSALFDLINDQKRPASNMLFFVMYDIESNKVRSHVVKYLERQGCHRVQKSIFLADLPNEKYEKIRSDLAEVQACYENDDSIIVVPISTDYLKAMSIIGKNINIDVIMKNKNTLFF